MRKVSHIVFFYVYPVSCKLPQFSSRSLSVEQIRYSVDDPQYLEMIPVKLVYTKVDPPRLNNHSEHFIN